MSKQLAELLGNDHPLFVYNIAQLERAAGGDGVDVELIGTILGKAHQVIREIGLDGADTSAEELYHALNALVKNGRAESLLTETSYVLMKVHDDIVSFCLQDVIENAHHELQFSERKIDHAQRNLRMEIVKQYAQHDAASNILVDRLVSETGIHKEEDIHHAVGDQWLRAMSSSPDRHTPSLLMIGDIFTDAFIQLNEEYAKVETDESGAEWLKLPFGAKPPYERVDIVRSVGPSPNAAVSCARLGLDVSLMAWVGGDDVGKEAIKHLVSENIKVGSMVTEQDKATSYWYVLRHGSERTMLVKSEKYSYVWHDPDVVPEWIYLAYIGEDSWHLHEDLLAYLQSHPEVKFVFQPATYHFEWGVEKLAGLYGRAHMVVMNREEAMQVTGKGHEDLKALAGALHELGPQIVVITDGSHGSYASHDGQVYNMPNYPDPAPPVDRTGAGDAFASTITAGLALGKSIDEALVWAPVNSASVVQEIGAQRGLLRMDTLQEWLSKAPEDYTISQL